jgi:hypothetical protein
LAGDALPGWLTGILEAASLPTAVRPGLLTPENLPLLSQEAAAQWTAQFNPVAVDAGSFHHL